jgi:hypothetical protein
VLEPVREELGLALGRAVQVGLAQVVQVVGPVEVIQQGIIRRQVEQLLERRRRDRPGNQRQKHQQSASSSDASPSHGEQEAAPGSAGLDVRESRGGPTALNL